MGKQSGGAATTAISTPTAADSTLFGRIIGANHTPKDIRAVQREYQAKAGYTPTYQLGQQDQSVSYSKFLIKVI